MKKLLIAAVVAGSVFASMPLVAEEIFRIEVGRDYGRYTNDELRRRVWQLERAVDQLQMRIYQLEAKPVIQPVVATPEKEWTCHIQSFATTHVASAKTKSAALADVLKKCSEASHAMHCNAKDAKCDSE